MNLYKLICTASLFMFAALAAAKTPNHQERAVASVMAAPVVSYHRANVDGLSIFYRESGAVNAPTIVLLHGFPSSSHMFRNLIPLIATDYHVIAPDYPGYGYSDAPSVDQFQYTFDHLADVTGHLLEQLNVQRYSIYIQDYGSPVGFRLATRHPERIQAIISQNGNAYEEGLGPFWAKYLYPYWKERNAETEALVRPLLTIETTKFQYTTGVRNVTNVSPDAWTIDQTGLNRPGNDAIQLALLYDYRTNPPLYPLWHKYLQDRQVPVLSIWGKNDPIFAWQGAEAFRRDDAKVEVILLDTGHFALEEDAKRIAAEMLRFLRSTVR